MASASKIAAVAKAVDDFKSGEFGDYSAAAKKHGIDRTTVSKHIRGVTPHQGESYTHYRQALTNAQKEVLIGHINSLTNRGMPPTTYIVKNLAEEIRGASIGKN